MTDAEVLTDLDRALTTRPQGAGAPFAAEVPVPPGVDRLAGFLGRPV